ncbi:MAG: hypothetical protein AAFR61_17750 [Bacteroidota bacterium]
MRVKVGFVDQKAGLAQALKVKEALVQNEIVVELIECKEKRASLFSFLDIKTSELWGKLDRAEVDLALWDGTDYVRAGLGQFYRLATLKRQDPRDVLISLDETYDLDNFANPWRIELCARRQSRMMNRYFPHLIQHVRDEEVPLKFEKLKKRFVDGLLLPYSVAQNHGLQSYILRKIKPHMFTPALGQGITVVTSRKNMPQRDDLQLMLHHPSTDYALQAETAFGQAIQATEADDVLGLATVISDTISLTAGLANPAGDIWIDTLSGNVAEAADLGEKMAAQIKSKLTN